MNQLNDVKQFIETWDSGLEQNNEIKKFLNKSILGNINIKGDYHSDTSVLFTKNDTLFYKSIEECVRKLVCTLAHRFNWITYSSCQGHPSYNGIAYKKRIVQLLPRTDQEKKTIMHQLITAKNEYNQLLPKDNDCKITVLIIQEQLTSIRESKDYETIKIKFDNNNLEENQYFDLIDNATETFISCLENTFITNISKKNKYLKPSTIVVILKITERCNIDCTYCYFFNGIDDSFKNHKGKISLKTVNEVADYFKNACIQYNIKIIRFDFHGGEPLLAKPNYLSSVCDILIETLSGLTNIEFTLQTNAMLLSDEWISVFNKYKINLGISIDGPEEYHDKYRVDHHGKGTYEKTREKIELLRSHYRKGNINFGIGILSVINPEFSAKKIYRHFVDELKFNSFDFLFPDNTWDSIDSQDFSAERYGLFLCDLFDEWIKDNNPKIYIRILNTIIDQLINKKVNFHDFGGWLNDFLLVTVNSEGGLSPDDTYRSADPKLMKTELNVENSKFDDLLNHPSIQLLYDSSNTLSEDCFDCTWKRYCKSGSLLHRYREKDGFTNRSVYCDALKIIYKKIFNHLEWISGASNANITS